MSNIAHKDNEGGDFRQAMANAADRDLAQKEASARATLLQAKSESEGRKLASAVVQQPPVDPVLEETFNRLGSDKAAVDERLKRADAELTTAMEEFANLSNKIAVLGQQRAKLHQQSLTLSMARAQMSANFKLNVPDPK